MSKRSYYRGPDALVTSEKFVWRTAPARVFAIRELRKVGIVRAADDDGRSTSAHVAGGSVILVAATWPVWDTPQLVALGALIIAVPGVVAAACWRMRPQAWELRATYRGMDVILYASSDVRVFNQVSRGLRRSMEDARLLRSWDSETAA
jgi:Family of unknown function (DUF6232)